MSEPSATEEQLGVRIASWIDRHAAVVLVGAVAVTAALVVPLALMKPTASASQEPPGPVFEAQRLVEERFASRAHRAVYLVEARDGNVLAKAPLLELHENLTTLREDTDAGAKLWSVPAPPPAGAVRGANTLADAVDGALRRGGGEGLRAATDEQVAAVVGRVLASAPPGAFLLSADAAQNPGNGRWTAAAMMIPVFSDNESLGGGGQATTLGTDDTTKEEHNRAVLRLLRGDERSLRIWGLAIDVNLTSAEQGARAGPFIAATIVAVLLLVGFAFRSYWAVAVTGFGLGALVVWLQGLSNLIGLKNDQILSIIVPIAMISFGVDNTFHAYGRCREERSSGKLPRPAFVAGLGGVLGALVVAFGSDAAAFVANASSGIESLVQFAIAAPLALAAAFFMLGVVTPLALSIVEARVGPNAPPALNARTLVFGLSSILAASAVTTAVLLMLFFDPLVGASVLGGYLLVFLVAPAVVGARLRRRAPEAAQGSPDRLPADFVAPDEKRSALSRALGRVVVAVARRRAVVLPAVAAATLGCGYLAAKVEPRFDVRDFFDPESDFVVSLERFERHVGERGGEPAVVYVEADVTDPAVVAALHRFVAELQALDTAALARDAEGRVAVERGFLGIVDAALGSEAARGALSARLGTPSLPESVAGLSAAELRAIYELAMDSGVPGARGPTRAADAVERLLWRGAEEGRWATHLDVRVPGSGDQRSIEEARDALTPAVERLRRELSGVDAGSSVVLTGQTMTRLASLEAVFRAFQRSLPVAVALCLLVAFAFMRSFRLAAVSVVPVLLVVVWLYALMYGLGQAVNVVTATIGAISVGIGIDFAVHLTMRYREEISRLAPLDAIEAAGGGTGTALASSALSSVVGFGILAFAPMPMFAAYGLLTAVMISFALVASLLVLPSLLLLVTKNKR